MLEDEAKCMRGRKTEMRSQEFGYFFWLEMEGGGNIKLETSRRGGEGKRERAEGLLTISTLVR